MFKNVVNYMQVNACMPSGVHHIVTVPALPRRLQKAASIAGNHHKACFTPIPIFAIPD